MKQAWMGLVLLLGAGVAQAGPTELDRTQRGVNTPARDAVPPRHVRPLTSPARKAEITRRMFLLALCLR